MSELTRCNFCTLAAMRRAAKQRRTQVVVVHHVMGEWAGWVSAWPKDQPTARHRFMKLGTHCEC